MTEDTVDNPVTHRENKKRR